MRRGEWRLVEDGSKRETADAPLVAYLKCCGHQETEFIDETAQGYVTFRFEAASERKDDEGNTRGIEQDRSDWLMFNAKHQVDVHRFFDMLKAVHGRIAELRGFVRGGADEQSR